MAAEIASSELPALLFTDAWGRVVFVDRNFFHLLGERSVGSLVGEPLYRVLNVERQAISDLLNDVAQAGYVQGRTLRVQDASGRSLSLVCSGVATYDDKGTFIGMDVTLHPPEAQRLRETSIHGDIIFTRIRQIQAEVEKRRHHQQQMMLQTYFTAHINALYILLGRMAGPRVCNSLQESLNRLASQNGWQVSLSDGIVTIEGEMEASTYRVLLAEAVSFSVSVVGRRLVAHEMSAVDAQMDARLLEVAEQAAMREFFR
jgi:hypothetical protein